MEKEESELEKKTREYEYNPGHILGLDGWILRSIPYDRREEFLNGYERLLKVTLHPDRTQDPKEKNRREKYLQSVSQAVTFMTSDPTAFDLTVDTVGTTINPLVSLRKTLQQRDEMVDGLKRDLDSLGAKMRELEGMYQKDRIGLLKARKKNVQLSHIIQNQEILKELNIIHMNAYSLNLPLISLRGKYISFNKGNDTDLVRWISTLDLSDITTETYALRVKEFCRLIEKDHLTEKEERIQFRKKIWNKNSEERIALMGILPFEGMLQYLSINYTFQDNLEDVSSQSLRRDEAVHLLSKLHVKERLEVGKGATIGSQKGERYAALLRPFIVPRVGVNVPVVLRNMNVRDRFRRIKSGMRPYTEIIDTYKLLYVTEIKTG